MLLSGRLSAGAGNCEAHTPSPPAVSLSFTAAPAHAACFSWEEGILEAVNKASDSTGAKEASTWLHPGVHIRHLAAPSGSHLKQQTYGWALWSLGAHGQPSQKPKFSR